MSSNLLFYVGMICLHNMHATKTTAIKSLTNIIMCDLHIIKPFVSYT